MNGVPLNLTVRLTVLRGVSWTLVVSAWLLRKRWVWLFPVGVLIGLGMLVWRWPPGSVLSSHFVIPAMDRRSVHLHAGAGGVLELEDDERGIVKSNLSEDFEISISENMEIIDNLVLRLLTRLGALNGGVVIDQWLTWSMTPRGESSGLGNVKEVTGQDQEIARRYLARRYKLRGRSGEWALSTSGGSRAIHFMTDESDLILYRVITAIAACSGLLVASSTMYVILFNPPAARWARRTHRDLRNRCERCGFPRPRRRMKRCSECGVPC